MPLDVADHRAAVSVCPRYGFTLAPRMLPSPRLYLLCVAIMVLGLGAPARAREPGVNPPKPPESLSAAEFSRLIRDTSEDGGYFHSDNFTSNETSYLHIVDRLRQLAGTGGAYIGVGPEQNFTYIAKVRPQIAFIVDIRRQAIIQ